MNYQPLVNYYLREVEKGNVIAMYGLGFHYQFHEKNEGKMDYYYCMAIQHGDRDSYINYTNYYYYDMTKNKNNIKMGYLYQFIKKDINKMLFYYHKEIEEDGNSKGEAFNMLGYYYYTIGDYDKMKHYYKMAINLGDVTSMNELGYYYESCEKYELMEICYLMANNTENLMNYYYQKKIYTHTNAVRLHLIKLFNLMSYKPFTNNVKELLFYFTFTIDDDICPMLRKKLIDIHGEYVGLLDNYIYNTYPVGNMLHMVNRYICYHFLTTEKATKLYYMRKMIDIIFYKIIINIK